MLADSAIQGFNLTANFLSLMGLVLTLITMVGGLIVGLFKYVTQLNINMANLTNAIDNLGRTDSDLEERVAKLEAKRSWFR